MMKKAEEILKEYIDFDDVNGSEAVELLPLTIVDIMEEYASQFCKHDVSGSLPYPIEIWDGIKVDVSFRGGRLVIQKANDH